LDSSAECADALQLQDHIERLQSRLRLAVIFGGSKSTPGSVVYPSSNSRSWKSYESVAQDIAGSLRRLGFRHVQAMPEDMYLGDRLRREEIHLAWLNTGGVQGYNSVAHAPATLEMLGVPYIGHDPLSATTLDNKHAFKREAVCAGLPTAPFCIWHMARGAFRPDMNSLFRAAFEGYPGPFIVKPVSGRASLHVHVVEDAAALPDMVAEVYRATQNVVLIEKYLSGREFCIAVAGPVVARGGRLKRSVDPFTFSILERIFSPHEKIFTSMDVRPITKDRFRALDQRDAKLVERMRQLACQVFREFNLSSLIRIDMRADENGKLCILEANPKPDLKRPVEGRTSLIAAGLAESGMDYDDLILSLLADRLDYLFAHRRGTVQHIIDLLDNRPSGKSNASVNAAAEPVSDMNGHSGTHVPEPRATSRKGNVRSVMAVVEELTTSARRIDALAGTLSRSVNNGAEHAERVDATASALVANVEKIGSTVALINEIATEMNVLALASAIDGSRGRAPNSALRKGRRNVEHARPRSRQARLC
jgi:D-alanine-D-alanine ligase